MRKEQSAQTNNSHAKGSSEKMTCITETKVKRVLNFIIWDKQKLARPTDRGHEIPQHTRYKTMASAIQSIFHDAQDRNSLKLNSTVSNTVASVDSAKYGDYGGVDGCLYIPLPNWNLGSWIHKREIHFPLDFITLHDEKDALVARTAGKFAIEACEILCCTDGHLTTEEKHVLCGPELSICSPKVPHAFPDTWHARAQEPEWVHSMENVLKDKCVVDMHVLGALLIVKMAGGPKIDMTWGRRHADCNKLFPASKVGKEFTPFPIWLNAAPLHSFGSPHRFVQDFARMGFNEREMAALMGAHSFGKIHKYAGDFAPRNKHSGFCNSNRTVWGDGGYWDKTPDVLDNEYFKDLDTIDPAEKEVCCADRNQCGCGTIMSEQGKLMQFWNGSVVPGQGCSHKWCMRAGIPGESHFASGPRNKDESNWAMLTTQEQMPQWNEFKYGPAPKVRRYMLAADWALLESPLAREAVRNFSKSEEAFFSAFKQAFDKATKLGHPSASIKTCSGPPPDFLQVNHIGENCSGPCGGKAGFCDWCGSGGACCEGVETDPTECQWGMKFVRSKQGDLHCVKTILPKTGTQSGMGAATRLMHHGEACWEDCNQIEGKCAWCGSAGACCHWDHKERWKQECKQAVGFIRDRDYACVLLTT